MKSIDVCTISYGIYVLDLCLISNNWRTSLLFSSRAHRAGKCLSINNFILFLLFGYFINFSTILLHNQLVPSANDKR